VVRLYSKKILEFFRNPKHLRKLDNPNGEATIGNPQCGDQMVCQIKVEKNKNGNEIIKDIGIQTYGCVAAIASSEALCSIVEGKTLEESTKITKDEIIKFLGGKIPAIKTHCSVLASEALKKAIENYEKKHTD